MRTKSALITGGAGFIGSYLAELLLADGYAVVALDNVSTGSHRNIEHLKDNENFQLVVADVEDPEPLGDLIRHADLVYHLAAAVGVRRIVEDPIGAITTNIRGTESVLELANRWQKPVLIASTSEVYGKNPNPSFAETDDLVLGATHNSRWSYACSKAIDEYLAYAYYRDRNLQVTIARLFNVVGPRQTGHYGMVIPRFVRQAMNDEPLTVHGDGSQRRTFTHVTDAARALHALLLHPGAPGGVFNVGGDTEISIMDLALLIKGKLMSTSEIKKIPFEEVFGVSGFEDMERRVPNLTKLRDLIGYRPTHTIDEIVDSVIAYFKANPDFV